MKVCCRCLESKSDDQFDLHSGRLRSACKICRKAESREYNSRPENKARRKGAWGRLTAEQKLQRKLRHKINHLRRKFGLTPEQYADLIATQGALCAICRFELRSESRYVHVDHCHRSGRVRGVLCQKCNAALGMVNDSTEILKNAISYLELNGVRGQ